MASSSFARSALYRRALLGPAIAGDTGAGARFVVAGLAVATLALTCTIPAVAAPRRFRVEPPEVVVGEPVWLCVERGAPPERVRLDGREEFAPAAIGAARGGTRLHEVIEWPPLGPLEVLSRLQLSVTPGHAPQTEATGYLPPGSFVFSADGFEPETLRVREPTPQEEREYALLRRARMHLQRGDSARAARLLRDFLPLARHPSAVVAARLELLSVLAYTEYADRPKLWLAEWVARHHPNCVVGAGIAKWIAAVPEEVGTTALREIAGTYTGTRAGTTARELLELSSVRENNRGRSGASH